MDDFDSNSVDVSSDEDSEDEWVEAMTCLSHLHLTASGDQQIWRTITIFNMSKFSQPSFQWYYFQPGDEEVAYV